MKNKINITLVLTLVLILGANSNLNCMDRSKEDDEVMTKKKQADKVLQKQKEIMQLRRYKYDLPALHEFNVKQFEAARKGPGFVFFAAEHAARLKQMQYEHALKLLAVQEDIAALEKELRLLKVGVANKVLPHRAEGPREVLKLIFGSAEKE